jgi:hypothetical protein
VKPEELTHADPSGSRSECHELNRKTPLDPLIPGGQSSEDQAGLPVFTHRVGEEREIVGDD